MKDRTVPVHHCSHRYCNILVFLRYRVDKVHYVDELPEVLSTLGKGGSKATLLTLQGINTDSKKHTRPAAFDGN